MDNIDRYRAINYKGKREFLWDPKGRWIRKNNEFVNLDKTDEVDDLIKKELNLLLKNNPRVKTRLKQIKDLKKKLYYAKVWILTEANDLTVLKNHHKRSFKGFHLDHIFPIIEGFKNNIPPEAISHIDNLRFITRKKNLKKGADVNESDKEIILEILKKISK
jgi:hypothetical protein